MSKLREEILNRLHIMGCQAMTHGHNDAKNDKDIDLDWIEEFEEKAANELVTLFERQLVEELEHLATTNPVYTMAALKDRLIELKANKSRVE